MLRFNADSARKAVTDQRIREKIDSSPDNSAAKKSDVQS